MAGRGVDDSAGAPANVKGGDTLLCRTCCCVVSFVAWHGAACAVERVTKACRDGSWALHIASTWPRICLQSVPASAYCKR
eukprot:1899520-Pleurochrysis_carterae.AAC.3